ncbi:hypothetical protein [Sphingomonas sp. DC1100-1]|uniref:hypothetical protein n=1 Tax=unclassified Sphingomonas TaxID=196159 RepID=UPI003CF7EC4F
MLGFAGQFDDKWHKAAQVRAVKAVEIGIMMLVLGGFSFQSVPVLLAYLFLMDMHPITFELVEYSILPRHLDRDELMGSTGLFEVGTFLAIVTRQLLGGLIPRWKAAFVAVAVAAVGFVASLTVPSAPAAARGLVIERNVSRSTVAILSVARARRGVWPPILGISWLFSFVAILMSEFAPLVSGTLGAGAGPVTLSLLVFSILAAGGSLAVSKLLGGEVTAGYEPIAALGMAASLIALWIVTRSVSIAVAGADISAFLVSLGGWPILAGLIGPALSGGVFIVPLYALPSSGHRPGGTFSDDRGQQHRQRLRHGPYGGGRDGAAGVRGRRSGDHWRAGVRDAHDRRRLREGVRY